jgi:ribosome biogenesis protein BRX1
LLSGKGLIREHAEVFENLLSLIPHAKRDQSIPSSDFAFIGDIAGDRHCDVVGVFETRHRKVNRECYFWIARVPDGPSVCFFVEDAQSINELHLIGNCLKGSRPILQFDPTFNDNGIYEISKNLLIQLFSVPFQDPHSKPFVDRTMVFVREENAIVIRHYQVQWGDDQEVELAEVGPRVRLLPNLVLAGVFRGHKLWKDSDFVTPYQQVKAERKALAERRKKSRDRQAVKEERRGNLPEIEDPNAGLFDDDDDDDDDD